MLWSVGWLPLPIRLHIPRQLTMYCVFQIHYFDGWWDILRVKLCLLNCVQGWWEISINLCVIIFWNYIIFGQVELYGLFFIQILQWLSFKFYLHLLLLLLVGLGTFYTAVCNRRDISTACMLWRLESGSPIFPPVVNQPCSSSIWPAVPSLRKGLLINQVVTTWCVCGCSWRDELWHYHHCHGTFQ